MGRGASVLALGLVATVSVASAEPPPPPHARVLVLQPHAPADAPARAAVHSLVAAQPGWLTPPFDASAPGVADLPTYSLDVRVTNTELTTSVANVTVQLCIEQTSPEGPTFCVSDEASAALSMPSGPSIAQATDAAARETWLAAQDFIHHP